MKNPSLCVFCGSELGKDPIHAKNAHEFGELLAMTGIQLVYGGTDTGLMGVIAGTVLKNGGRVTGVIPHQLKDSGQIMRDLTEYNFVSGYHERKKVMFELSDGFCAFTGGPGTLEELAEQLAWKVLNAHTKPIYLINISGYWNPWIEALEKIRESGFIAPLEGTDYQVFAESKMAIEAFASAVGWSRYRDSK